MFRGGLTLECVWSSERTAYSLSDSERLPAHRMSTLQRSRYFWMVPEGKHALSTKLDEIMYINASKKGFRILPNKACVELVRGFGFSDTK
jgi:hypothetical protein